MTIRNTLRSQPDARGHQRDAIAPAYGGQAPVRPEDVHRRDGGDKRHHRHRAGGSEREAALLKNQTRVFEQELENGREHEGAILTH